MKRNVMVMASILALGTVSPNLAQGPDLKKMKQELEIMKGILQTTMSFVARDIRQREAGSKDPAPYGGRLLGSPDIDAFYLQGQGAVFVISTSGLRSRIFITDQSPIAGRIGLQAEEAYRQALEAQQDALRAVEAAQAEFARGVLPPPPPEPPKPPQAAPAPTPKPAGQQAQAQKQEEMRRKLQEAQEKVKQRQEELKAREKKYQEYLEEISAYLVEALANHGDSITALRPGEYINLVLTGNDTFDSERLSAGSEGACRLILVQKSVVADYKAGRLTLEAFRQKVLRYTM